MQDFLRTYQGLGILCLSAFFALIISRHILLPIFTRIAKNSRGPFNNLLVKHKAVERFSHLIPAIVLYMGIPKVLSPDSPIFQILLTFNNLYFIIVGYFVYDSVLRAFADRILLNPAKRSIPINGVRQAALLVGFIICTILSVSQLTGKSPIILLSGLSALAAVFMLIFRDSILGFTAGVQIAALDLVRNGDWIEIPKEDINGVVEYVSLTSIKLRNWDNTTSILPAYDLVSTPFKNWRRMWNTGSRRIKRSILIDGRTVAPVSSEQIQQLKSDGEICELLPQIETLKANSEANIRLFRQFVTAYLKSLKDTDKERLLFARELESSDGCGIPLELYFFSKITSWADYETFSADIVDHLMIKMPLFGLKLYVRVRD